MRSDDHDMRAHVKLLFRRLAWPIGNPGAGVHVGNAKSIDALRPASKAVGSPLKENFIKASRLVMRSARWWTRKAGPFTTPLTENPEFASLLGRPIQDSRVVGYEMRSGPECVRNLLSVSHWQMLSHVLSARCDSEKRHCGQQYG